MRPDVLELMAEEIGEHAVNSFALLEWERGGFNAAGPRAYDPGTHRDYYLRKRARILARRAERYWADPQAARAASRDAHARHREERNAKARAHRRKNPGAQRLRVLAWKRANRERVNARARELYRQKKGGVR